MSINSTPRVDINTQRYKLLIFVQKEINSLISPTSNKEIKFMVKNPFKKVKFRPKWLYRWMLLNTEERIILLKKHS